MAATLYVFLCLFILVHINLVQFYFHYILFATPIHLNCIYESMCLFVWMCKRMLYCLLNKFIIFIYFYIQPNNICTLYHFIFIVAVLCKIQLNKNKIHKLQTKKRKRKITSIEWSVAVAVLLPAACDAFGCYCWYRCCCSGLLCYFALRVVNIPGVSVRLLI